MFPSTFGVYIFVLFSWYNPTIISVLIELVLKTLEAMILRVLRVFSHPLLSNLSRPRFRVKSWTLDLPSLGLESLPALVGELNEATAQRLTVYSQKPSFLVQIFLSLASESSAWVVVWVYYYQTALNIPRGPMSSSPRPCLDGREPGNRSPQAEKENLSQEEISQLIVWV